MTMDQMGCNSVDVRCSYQCFSRNHYHCVITVCCDLAHQRNCLFSDAENADGDFLAHKVESISRYSF